MKSYHRITLVIVGSALISNYPDFAGTKLGWGLLYFGIAALAIALIPKD